MQDAIVVIGIVAVSLPIVVAVWLWRNAVRRRMLGAVWRPLERLRDGEGGSSESAIYLEPHDGDIPKGVDCVPLDELPARNGPSRTTQVLRRLLWGEHPSSSTDGEKPH